MIKVVTFDLDGVFFVNAHKNVVKNFAQKYNLDEDFLKEVLFMRASREGGYDDLKRGKIRPSKYWKWLFKTLEIKNKVTKNDYLEILQSGYNINQKAVELIKKLHNQGIRIAVCSNNYKDNIDLLEKRFNLSRYFDIMVFSYEVGVLKPNVKIFQELVKRSGVKPEEIVFADDNYDNLQGAKNVGIQAFFYKGFDQFLRELEKLGIDL